MVSCAQPTRELEFASEDTMRDTLRRIEEGKSAGGKGEFQGNIRRMADKASVAGGIVSMWETPMSDGSWGYELWVRRTGNAQLRFVMADQRAASELFAVFQQMGNSGKIVEINEV